MLRTQSVSVLYRGPCLRCSNIKETGGTKTIFQKSCSSWNVWLEAVSDATSCLRLGCWEGKICPTSLRAGKDDGKMVQAIEDAKRLVVAPEYTCVKRSYLSGCLGVQWVRGIGVPDPEPPYSPLSRPPLLSEALSQSASLQLTSRELLALAGWGEAVRSWGWDVAVDEETGACRVARVPLVLDKPLGVNDFRSVLLFVTRCGVGCMWWTAAFAEVCWLWAS